MTQRPWRALALAAVSSSVLFSLPTWADAGPAAPAQGDAGFPPRATLRTPAAPMGVSAAGWLTRPEREAQEAPERMLAALHVRPGDTVADVGAGVGFHAWRLSARVGPTGTVYATDIQPEMLQLLRDNMAARGVRNVVPVQAREDDTGLPRGAVDLVLLVDVYHEVQAPLAFLRQVRRALKPAGRLALVEFRAEDPAVPIRAEHKMTAEQVIAELAAGGFRLTERDESLPWQHLLVFVPVQ